MVKRSCTSACTLFPLRAHIQQRITAASTSTRAMSAIVASIRWMLTSGQERRSSSPQQRPAQPPSQSPPPPPPPPQELPTRILWWRRSKVRRDLRRAARGKGSEEGASQSRTPTAAQGGRSAHRASLQTHRDPLRGHAHRPAGVVRVSQSARQHQDRPGTVHSLPSQAASGGRGSSARQEHSPLAPLSPSEGPRPLPSQQPSASGLETDLRRKAAHTRLRLLRDRLHRRTQSSLKSSLNSPQRQTPSKPPRRIIPCPANEA